MKKLLLGNEAVARGLYEAGVHVVSSYPGTPSTEITEYAAEYNEIYTEWAPNEKVAAEAAFGASQAGGRSFCGMKHVGLNVAADPLFTASYIGVTGGFVIGVADDPGMHSSQNEQDSRHYAIASKMPMLEPSDSAECKEFTKLAYELSEQFDTPVYLRLVTRIAHSRSLVEINERQEVALKKYEKNQAKNIMLPAFARQKHPIVEQRTLDLQEYAESSAINRVELGGTGIGIICAGSAYCYAKEALGEEASYLKLGMVYPLPVKLIKDFAAKVEKLYVIEELDPIIENHCRQIGVEVIGKELFPLCGEFTQATVKAAILGQKEESLSVEAQIPPRPPALCSGCPHRGVFYILKKLGVFVSGDIGCYTLGAAAPLFAIDTNLCMGSSISALHGVNKANPEFQDKAVAVIGDSTFLHTGINSLINVAYNRSNSVSIILDNSITGMTGHQQNPATGYNIKGEPANAICLEDLCRSVGINSVVVVDPYNLEELERVLKEELAKDEPSVIITRRPCVLLKYVKPNPPLYVNKEKCKSCKACMRIGCPAISFKGGKAEIDRTLCVGCGVCVAMCKFDSIGGEA
ncbi:MAG: indolepyruvate ferredoxin oxidoreductase subunit alpha [Oscillospiraceae bacterium]|jgi:indolepyruvate ferredoxin oxidoreductase alpha subunit|nr:indolepyruvate ferredoxin oxidoreductase subunit alpha [Oscillospiraceae bacterium]